MRAAITRLASIGRVAAKRLLSGPGLALATALGLTVAVALIMSVPLYADGVYFRLLRAAVVGRDTAVTGTPLALRFRYVGARDGPQQWEDVQALDAYLAGPAGQELGLPQRSCTRHFKTDIFRIYYPDSDPEAGPGLTWLSLATVSDLTEQVYVKQGRLPTGDAGDGSLEVLVNEQAAIEYGLPVGELLLATHGDSRLLIRIAGTWAPVEPHAGFWSSPLAELALVSEETFAQRISPPLPDEIYLGLWQIILDGAGLHATDVTPLLSRIDGVQRQAAAYLPHVVLDSSPAKPLQEYRRGVPELTFLLLAFSVPMMAMLLAFVGLVGGIYVERQRNQIAVLRSRGATSAQVAGMAALEAMLLGLIALALGTPLALGIAWLIGQARSFMDFSGAPDLRVSLTPEALAIGVATVAIALLAQLLPTFGAAANTIVTYKQEQARLLRPPWWQRFGLDGALLVPTAYGFYTLQRQGRLAAEGGAAVHDIFQDPLLFLTPVLGLFALTLFVARILPLAMGGIAWIAGRCRSVGLALASRQIARAPGLFSVPLILLVLTLSLSAFTASLAQTLDGHLAKQTYYQAGADLRLCEIGVTAPVTGTLGARWFFQPVESHLGLPGVEAATRVGRYPAVVELLDAPVTATFVGLDRLDFPRVAYWQRSFSPSSLGTLMNALAAAREGVLVTPDLLASQGLRVGDPVSVIVSPYDVSQAVDLRIVGVVELFPTWYPGDGPLFVGNLDYLFEELGLEFPYEVWLHTAPDADQRRIVAGVRGLTALLDPTVDSREVVEEGLNIVVTEWRSAPLQIASEQERPQRQGLFGLLSIGFVASALLTVLGFLLYALFSFRRRFIELGVLRAIGLSLRQMIGMLGWELAALIVTGVAAGTGLGVLVSLWFIPYLQVGVEASSRFPPFVVAIAWPAMARIYLLFAVLFVAALGGLVALLARMRISQAVKLGESV